MFVKMYGAGVVGIAGQLIEVEVNLSPGLPMVSVVGLPDPAVRESVERVRAAILNGDMTFPLGRITVNLAPADVRKEGSAFDLAIAAGILCASGQWNGAALRDTLLIGELSLSGEVRPVPGVLPMVEAARAAGLKRVIVPRFNAAEACLIDGIEVAVLDSLSAWNERGAEAVRPDLLAGGAGEEGDPVADDACDLGDVRGQLHGKRALMVAAAGMHNLMFVGPPGTGKTMLCRRLPTLLPPLDDEEAMTVTKIYSASGKLTMPRAGLIRRRPFRAPHHTISMAGLVGGGSVPKPGEVTLAHHGVLFLDELPEFPRAVLETLRQPLEDREVTIGRARAACRFPAQFLLAASMNPCPCGKFGGDFAPDKACTCTEGAILRYRSRISGPFLDRIDLQVELPLQKEHLPETQRERERLTSAEARRLVMDAYEMQRERYKGTGIRWNSELQGRMLERYAVLSGEAKRLLYGLYTQLGLSHRAHDRLLKVSRTIADLAGSERIEAEHVAEAAQYRCLDRPPVAVG